MSGVVIQRLTTLFQNNLSSCLRNQARKEAANTFHKQISKLIQFYRSDTNLVHTKRQINSTEKTLYLPKGDDGSLFTHLENKIKKYSQKLRNIF